MSPAIPLRIGWAGALLLGVSTALTPVPEQNGIRTPLVSAAPGSVTDLASVPGTITTTAVTLRFTEAASGVATPAKYDVRWGPTAGFTWAPIQGGRDKQVAGTTAAGGVPLQFTVTGLTPATAYSFQVVAYTGTLNCVSTPGCDTTTQKAVFGPLSNVATATTASSVVGTATVTVSPQSPSVTVGKTVQFAATVTDSTGAIVTRPVVWASLTLGVASITSTGLATAVTPGTSTISATSGTVVGSTLLTVIQAPVATVTVSIGRLTLFTGQTQQLGATLRDSAGNALAGPVTWASSQPTVAMVGPSGVVSAGNVGTTTISATAQNGVSGTCIVTVVTVPVAHVAIAPPVDTLPVGQTGQLVAILTDSVGDMLTGRPVNWSTGTPTLTSVTPQGLVTALAVGLGQVSATSGAITSTAAIVIPAPPPPPPVGRFTAKLSIAPDASFPTFPGQLVAYKAFYQDTTGAAAWVQPTWRASDTTVGAIRNTGSVVFRAGGVDTISASFNGVQSNVSVVTVAPQVFLSVAAAQFTNLPSQKVVDLSALSSVLGSWGVTGLLGAMPVSTGWYVLNMIGPARDTVGRAYIQVTGP